MTENLYSSISSTLTALICKFLTGIDPTAEKMVAVKAAQEQVVSTQGKIVM